MHGARKCTVLLGSAFLCVAVVAFLGRAQQGHSDQSNATNQTRAIKRDHSTGSSVRSSAGTDAGGDLDARVLRAACTAAGRTSTVRAGVCKARIRMGFAQHVNCDIRP